MNGLKPQGKCEKVVINSEHIQLGDVWMSNRINCYSKLCCGQEQRWLIVSASSTSLVLGEIKDPIHLSIPTYPGSGV